MSEAYMGEIKAYGFSFAPRNFAFCNGATLGISQNTALFSLLGTTFGGNGQTTFQLPNLGGRRAIGQGQSPGTSQYVMGEVGGVENVSLTINNLPAHNHVANTTVTPNSSGLAASSTLNVVTGVPPASRLSTPVGNLLTIPVVAAGGAVNAFAAPGGGTAGQMASGAITTSLTGQVTATAATTVQPTGNSGAFSIQTPYVAINYCIATVGIFPSRN